MLQYMINSAVEFLAIIGPSVSRLVTLAVSIIISIAGIMSVLGLLLVQTRGLVIQLTSYCVL